MACNATRLATNLFVEGGRIIGARLPQGSEAYAGSSQHKRFLDPIRALAGGLDLGLCTDRMTYFISGRRVSCTHSFRVV